MSISESEDIHELPAESRVAFPGPFEYHPVVVEGREVPFLEATPLDGGKIDLTVDKRYGLVLSVEESERIIPFLANAIAIALGYTSHPTTGRDEPTVRHPFPRVRSLA